VHAIAGGTLRMRQAPPHGNGAAKASPRRAKAGHAKAGHGVDGPRALLQESLHESLQEDDESLHESLQEDG
jgi:hypothetical protein